MKIYYHPLNLLEWNIFEKVKAIGHIEGFLATKAMEVGDLILLYAGKQNKNYKSGVYAIGEIVKPPYLYTTEEDCHCYGKLTVDVKIVKMEYPNPIISFAVFSKFNNQFRSVHVIKEEYYPDIIRLINL